MRGPGPLPSAGLMTSSSHFQPRQRGEVSRDEFGIVAGAGVLVALLGLAALDRGLQRFDAGRRHVREPVKSPGPERGQARHGDRAGDVPREQRGARQGVRAAAGVGRSAGYSPAAQTLTRHSRYVPVACRLPLRR
jgi:hypothetical protein